MWDAQTKKLVADEKLVVIGVVQEQHAERARLYKQWRQFDFPIVQDAITELGSSVVPIPILIDEHGVVMSTRPLVNKIGALTAQQTTAPAKAAPKLDADYRDQIVLNAEANEKKDELSDCLLGDVFLNRALTGDDPIADIDRSIKSYESFVANNADSDLLGHVHFRLGVAYRMKFDVTSPEEQDPNDFTVAAKHWSSALAVNPNQYIWRRRIQQYGPRLAKPYPFYDWVAGALEDIKKRGETPVELTVALAGAERARPNRKFTTAAKQGANPDPESRITLDTELATIHPTAVPQAIAPGQAVRVHLRFDLGAAEWNNESEDMIVWIEPSEFGSVSQSYWSYPSPETPESSETRVVEFEFKSNKSSKSEIELTGYALYYVCQQDNGQCLYRRQDFTIPITIDEKVK